MLQYHTKLYLPAIERGGTLPVTIEITIIIVILQLTERLRNDVFSNEDVPDELGFDLYLIQRELGLTHQAYEMHMISRDGHNRWFKASDLSQLLADWEFLGWIEGRKLAPPFGIKRYILPRQYRAYPPGSDRYMSDEELEDRLNEARGARKGTRVYCSRGCQRETLWKLIEEEIIRHNPNQQGHHNFVLEVEYR